MKKGLFLIFILSTFILVSSVAKDTVNFTIGLSVPPYVIANGKLPGLHVDIVKEVFLSMNKLVRFSFVPNARIETQFNKHGGGASQGKRSMGVEKKYTKVPMMIYFNRFIMKKSSKHKLSGLGDKRKYRMISFQNAKKYLGKNYKELTENSLIYREYGGHLPSMMLELDRVDIIVSDSNIFKYYLKKQYRENTKLLNFENYVYLSYLENANSYYWYFESEELAEVFHKGLKKIYKNKKIDLIFNKYKKEYGTSREPFIYIDCYYGKIPKACNHPELNKDLFKI